MRKIKAVQERILRNYLSFAAQTRFGEKHSFSSIKSYGEYRKRVPVSNTSAFQSDIEQMRAGRPDVLWPGVTRKFAFSAGTTGIPKQIPLTPEREASDRLFLKRAAISYLRQYPSSLFRVLGKHLSLPGQIKEDPDRPGVTYGEISGYLASFAPEILVHFNLMSRRDAVTLDFDEKMALALDRALKSNIRVFTTLPSIGLRFFQILLNKTGKQNMGEVWPGFKLFVCGGEPLNSFRKHISKLFEGKEIHFLENYGSSEGYFAFNSSQDRNDMQLMLDNNIFYEWIPDPSENRDDLLHQETVPTWEVETGRKYAMVVTSNSGLWRYLLYDLVMFTRLDEPRIVVPGRVTNVHDRYGEAIESIHVRQVLEEAVRETGGIFSNYSLGVIMDSERDNPTHIWFIEWAEKPQDMQHFAELIDHNLIRINRSYEIRRKGGAISPPRFYDLNGNGMGSWQEKFYKIGAQTKVPRMIHDEERCRDLMKRCRRSV